MAKISSLMVGRFARLPRRSFRAAITAARMTSDLLGIGSCVRRSSSRALMNSGSVRKEKFTVSRFGFVFGMH